MPSYIVSLKDTASDAEVTAAKEQAKAQGGKITHEYSLIKGFTVEYPEGTVQTLDSLEQVDKVEADQIVTTQS